MTQHVRVASACRITYRKTPPRWRTICQKRDPACQECKYLQNNLLQGTHICEVMRATYAWLLKKLRCPANNSRLPTTTNANKAFGNHWGTWPSMLEQRTPAELLATRHTHICEVMRITYAWPLLKNWDVLRITYAWHLHSIAHKSSGNHWEKWPSMSRLRSLLPNADT